MDHKSGRQEHIRGRRQRSIHTKNGVRNALTFLSTHKKPLFTGFLLLSVIVLLFGIFSQFQPPAASTPPNGVTVIDYSTFIGQVKSGNVLAVTVQGHDINGLLAKSVAQNQHATAPAVRNTSAFAADYAAWRRYISTGYSSWTTTSSTSTSFDPNRAVYARLPDAGDAGLPQLLASNHVTLDILPVVQTPVWLTLLWRFLPFLLITLLFVLFLNSRNKRTSMRTMDSKITGIGKSRARRFERTKEAPKPPSRSEKPGMLPTPASATTIQQAQTTLEPPVTFADVAGIDEVRTELEEIVQFLRSPERFQRLGARIPHGALLVGPPGTGKTLLAKAVAGEADVPFFSMSASEFVEMYVGVGASRVRDLFKEARQSAPCVIFIDEIDAVGRKRTMRVAGSDERDQTLNQLLVELDGFDKRQAVVVLAATNRADILDAALLRPGRFDRHIMVSLPDRRGREAILQVHTRCTPLHEEISLERLARLTTGMSGADLANLVNEAALSAVRQDLEHLTHDCFEQALARVQLGALRPIVMSERERRVIAFHEGGHALVAHHLPLADTVNRVTILARGQSLGVTQFTAEEDCYNYSREMLMSRIAVGLGGRAAEELTFGASNVTTGAENDLQVVTDLARRMVTRWGMSEQVGVVFADYRASGGAMGYNMQRIELPAQPRSLVADSNGELHLNGEDMAARRYTFAMSLPAANNSSTSMASVIDSEVQRILNEGYDMARTILRDHSSQLTTLADTLMELEQLDRQQFEELLMG